MLEPTAGHVILGPAHIPRHCDFAVVRLDLEQPLGQVVPEQGGNSLPPGGGGRQVMHAAGISRGGWLVGKREGHAGMGQGRPHERLGGVRPFRLRGPKKSPPSRHVAEQLPHLDRGADGAAVGHHLPHPPAIDREGRAGLAGWPRAKRQPGHLTDARQRFATKPERADAVEVIRRAEFARGVGGDGKRQLVGRDTAAIVHDPNQGDPPLFELNVDPGRSCVE